jgi:poly-gamma-glutamate synthesis protein (capsule biosynthesis protein)
VGVDDRRSVTELGRLVLAVAVSLGAVLTWQVVTEQPDPAIVASLPPAPPAATTAASTLTIAATGEILPHPSVVQHAARYGAASGRPYDFGPLFADLRPVLDSADVAICHLEVPVAPPGSELSGYPAFGIPAEIGAGIRDSGWDRCSTASNHANDRGTAGIRATLDALDAALVGHTGTARTVDEAAVVPVTTVNGIGVGHLSYTWGFNGTPPAEPWMADVIDPDRILQDAADARAAGAQVVVVSLHWGDEYDTVGTEDQRSLAAQLLASPDVDLLVGHGPHVLQPILEIGGEYALLSLGNIVANQGRERPGTYDGAIVEITFAQGSDGRFRASPPVAHPTWYDRDTGLVRLIETDLVAPDPAWVGSWLADSLDRTRTILGPYVVPIGPSAA